MTTDLFAALLSDTRQRARALIPEPPRQAALDALFAELDAAYAALGTGETIAQTLRWSEARFRTAAYLVSDSIYEVDLANDQTTIYGGEPYAEQGLELATLDIAAWEALLHPDDRDRVLAARQDLLTHNQPFRQEYRIVLPDGGVRFLGDRSVVLTQPDGRRRQIGVTTDTTDRVIAERRQQILVEASAVLNASLDVGNTAARLAALVVPALADWSVVYTVTGEVLHPTASAPVSGPPPPDDLRPILWRTAAHPIAEVFRDGQAVLLPESATTAPPTAAEPGAHAPRERAEIASMIAVPLTTSHRQIGVLVLGRAGLQQPYASADLVFARELAARAALALENARLYQAVQRQLAELTALHGVARAISSQLDLAELFQTVVAELSSAFGYQLVSIYLLQDDTLVPQATHGYRSALPALPLAGRIEQVIRSGEPVFIRDAAVAPAEPVLAAEARQAILVPLGDRAGSVQGLLLVESSDAPVLTDDDVALLTTLVAQVSLAIANARLFTDLQAVNSLLGGLLANAPAPIYAVTTDMYLRLVNPAFEALVKQGREQLIGRLVTDVFPGADGRAFVETNRRILAEGQSLLLEEFVETEAGQLIFQSAKFPLYDAAGQPDGIAGISIDITAHKQAETERLQLERRMLETQRLESLGLMAGGIAHDFNNVLTGVMGHAELALVTIPPEAPAHANVTTVLRSAHHAAELTSQLLAYAGKGRFAVEAVDLTTVVRETVELLRHTRSPSVALACHLAEGLPALKADRAQIRQVVLNLLTNAIEATETTQGTITVTTTAESLDEAAHAQQGTAGQGDGQRTLYVHLAVRDTGCGMDSATVARIFDPFFTTKFTGRGLGLAAVQGIVRAHRGVLKVESVPGVGSTFHLWLPAAEVRPATTPPPYSHAPLSSGGGRGTVLVIDDDDSVRAISQLFLLRMGFRCESAADGGAGLEAVARGIDGLVAVLLDLTMPQMTGDVVARRIRERWPELPIVLMSGYHSEELADKYADLRLNGFVQKPFSYDVLQAAFADAAR